jgi:hypothetical protein
MEAAMRRILLLASIPFAYSCLSFAAGADSPGLSFGQAQPDLALNALFEQKKGWIGGDGVNSVVLGANRRAWLFSDTWVGSVRDGKRFDATIVNNTVGIQSGGDAAKVKFIIGMKPDKKPAAMFTPADGRGWFWLQAGAFANGKLYMFLSQIEKTGSDVFGFRGFGQTLGIVDNPQDDPASWRLRQLKLPCTIFNTKRELTFGASILKDGEYFYVFGTDEDLRPNGLDRYLIVARVPVSQIEDFAAWRFYSAQRWESDFRAASRMAVGMASECSVSYLADFKQYVLVYTEGGLSPRILARTASSPAGPWSAATMLYRCPEEKWGKSVFCYAAKAHPSLAARDELVVSYCTNSFDFWQVAADARIYFPRFIRVKVTALQRVPPRPSLG